MKWGFWTGSRNLTKKCLLILYQYLCHFWPSWTWGTQIWSDNRNQKLFWVPFWTQKRSLWILLAWRGHSRVCSPAGTLLFSCSTKIHVLGYVCCPLLTKWIRLHSVHLIPSIWPLLDLGYHTDTFRSHFLAAVVFQFFVEFLHSRYQLSAVVLPAWGFFWCLTFRPSPSCSTGDADLVRPGDVRAGMCSHYLTSHVLQSSSFLDPMYRQPFGRPYTLQGMWYVDDICHPSSQGTSQGRSDQPEFSLQPATCEYARWLSLVQDCLHINTVSAPNSTTITC